MTTSTSLHDPTDVAGKRFVAAFVDWLIGFGLNVVLFFALAESADVGGLIGCSDLDETACVQAGDTLYVVEGSNSLVLYGVWFLFSFGVYVVWRGLGGATPGTLLLGLRCVNAEGRPPGIGRALLRSVAGIVDYIPCCFPLVGLITILTTPGHRRVGDMAAGTYVVDKSAVGRPVQPGGTPGAAVGPYGTVAAPPAAPATAAPTAAGGTPQWDPARNAYVLWDATSQVWYRFDDATQQWVPLT